MNSPEKWNKEADVVVVGLGGAGAVAAITANDAGAKVLMHEKQLADTPTEVCHTPNTRTCGGLYMTVKKGTLNEAAQYIYACSYGTNPIDVCKVWAEYSAENSEWIESIGGIPLSEEQFLRLVEYRYGKPIPRLHAAGELGSTFGFLYSGGGGNIAECIAFGRIAGENAAQEPPKV